MKDTGYPCNSPSARGTRRPRHRIFSQIKALVRFLLPQHRVIGSEHLRNFPAVFLCNHAGSYAPMMAELYFPVPFRPWVTYQVMTPKLCRSYIDLDFVRKELGLRTPLSGLVAAAIEPFCIQIMKSVEAIPVYKGTWKIRQTFRLSLEALRKGENLLIFPENQEKKYSRFLNGFNSGFLRLSRLYYQSVGKPLYYYPVFISRQNRTISIGEPIKDAGGSRESRKHLRSRLEQAVEKLAEKPC